MSMGRMEAFSDGVIAITVLPRLLSYLLSFIYLGIYWNNHHHMLQVTEHVSGGVLWANLHLLFWPSLVPFTTSWMGERHVATVPVAVYGGTLLAAAIAYYVLQTAILRGHGPDSALARALGADWKGRLSPVLYVAGPDRRLERAVRAGRTAAVIP